MNRTTHIAEDSMTECIVLDDYLKTRNNLIKEKSGEEIAQVFIENEGLGLA